MRPTPTDNLAPARGTLAGLAIVLPFWGVVIAAFMGAL